MASSKSTKSNRPVALTIAGSDPGGGAGIQADLKTFAAHGVYGYSVLTAVIAQNSAKITEIELVTPAVIEAQIEALVAECMPSAVKTGAMGHYENVKAVAKALGRLKMPAPVVDPVIVASSGARLLGPKGERAMRKHLIPIACVITPNIPEAEALTGLEIDSPGAIRKAAQKFIEMGAQAVVIKGGHGPRDKDAIDTLFDGRNFVEFRAPRLKGDGAHGTGCAFASAIAANLALGKGLEDSVRAAKRFVTAALKNGFRLNGGRMLLDHFARF